MSADDVSGVADQDGLAVGCASAKGTKCQRVPRNHEPLLQRRSSVNVVRSSARLELSPRVSAGTSSR